MARPKKTVVYNASTEVIREQFLAGIALDEDNKAQRALLTEYNVECAGKGVHPGAIALARRVRRQRKERRRVELREIARVLVACEDLILEEEGGTVVAPFGQRSAA